MSTYIHVMTATEEKAAYLDLRIQAKGLDDRLADLAKMICESGARFIELGKALQEPDKMNFDSSGFKAEADLLPLRIEEYAAAFRQRCEIEGRLQKSQYHQALK